MNPQVLVIEHEHGTGPGYLGECLESAGLHLDVQRPYLGDPLPGGLTGYAGLIVLGGTPGPFDDHVATWLPVVRELIAQALHGALPMLGVCLGGELLASVAGGLVQRAAAGPEVGLHTLTPTPQARDDALFAGLRDSAPAVEWHWEEIARLPPSATLLCSTERYPNQAFRIGEHAWGMQFHMEVLTDAATQWAANGHEELAAAGVRPDTIVEDIAGAEPQLRKTWGEVAARWAELVHRTAPGARAAT